MSSSFRQSENTEALKLSRCYLIYQQEDEVPNMMADFAFVSINTGKKLHMKAQDIQGLIEFMPQVLVFETIKKNN